MREEHPNRWRTFLLAFSLTLLALAFIMVLTVMAVQPSMPRQNRREDPPEVSYRPTAGDALTMAVIGKSGEGGATDFLLIRFNPQYGQVPLTLLPPGALVTHEGERMTLAQAFERGGGSLVKEALSERLGVAVDRYAVLPRDAFLRIAQSVGTVVFELPYPISYDRDGYHIDLPAGGRRLDAQDVADLFACPVFENGALGKSELLGELVAAIVNQNLDAAGEKRSSGLFKLAVNLVDTDVSAADYELRRDAADFLSQLDATVAGSLAPAGTLLEGGELELSEEFVSLARRYFGAAA